MPEIEPDSIDPEYISADAAIEEDPEYVQQTYIEATCGHIQDQLEEAGVDDPDLRHKLAHTVAINLCNTFANLGYSVKLESGMNLETGEVLAYFVIQTGDYMIQGNKDIVH